MKAASAIKKFLGQPGHNPEMSYTTPTLKEIVSMKEICTSEEWQELGRQACELMDVPFEPLS